MTGYPSVSILISTRDRADSLARTLESVAAAKVPERCNVEVILVDNGSTDATPEVIRSFNPSSKEVQFLVEPRPGKARALNRALRKANGEIFLFTDDDVRVPRHWIEGMISPIRTSSADAVAGGVRLASYLRHHGMNQQTAALLAATEGQIDPNRPGRLVGANMAIHRRVFDVISGFDVELGPGRLGLEEDTLLSLQILHAGMRIAGASDVVVDHCPGKDRVTHTALQQAAERVGRSDAYVSYHWRHQGGSRMRSWFGWIDASSRLAVYRLFAKTPTQGLRNWEHLLVRRKAYHRQMLREFGHPRKYAQFGYEKI